MLRQIFKIIKLLGFRRAARMKKHHDLGLAYIRGYMACNCWWALLHNGFLDELSAHGFLELPRYVADHPCN